MIALPRPALLSGAARPIRQALVAWGMVVGGLLAVAPAAAQQAGVGTPIVNVAQVTYRDANGNTGSANATATVSVNDQRVVLQLRPDREAVVAAGASYLFTHLLLNTGTKEDLVALAVSASEAWPVEIYVDWDGDGALGPGDTPTAEVRLAPNAAVALIVKVTVPAAAANGLAATLVVGAQSRDGTASATALDRVTVVRPASALFLSKTVDRPDAAAGDTVLYSLVARNQGGAASPAATLLDTLPRGVTLVSGSVRVDDAPQAATLARTADGRDVLSVELGQLAAGARATITFRALLGDAAGESARNVAQLLVGGDAISSGAADVRLALPSVQLRKELVGDSARYLGDTVAYRLRYTNASPTVRARSLVLTDTLPDGLELLRAPGASVSGRVLRWTLPDLAPLDSGTVTLVARVLTRPALGRIVNVAALEGANVKAVVAHALGVVVREGNAQLAITKSAGVLEAGAGEAIPYSVVVRNRGALTLRDVVVVDRMPDGVQLVGTPAGADSVRANGPETRFYLPTLDAGASATLRYSTVVLRAGRAAVLRNVATALAEGGLLRSDSAVAEVRTRGVEVQGRTIVGKVFLDANGNGRQDASETGVRGLRVWGADGEVVTTDAEGRFSFRDVLPGSYAVRLDTLGLPAGTRAPAASDLVRMLRTDGWTMPRLSFALRPGSTGASAAAVSQAAAPRAEGESGAVESVRVDSVRVPALRTVAAREQEAAQAAITGAVVRVFAPADGAVLWTNRVFVGVRGEPGRPVRLFDGERLVAEGELRGDGVYDFVGVEVTPGPHRFRVWMKNGMGAERWDSVAVHHAARADSIAVPAVATTLRTDAHPDTPLRVRVLDHYGVPVGAGTNVTVAATGVLLGGQDSDPTSSGEQRKVSEGGWLELAVRGARLPGAGRITVTAERATADVVVRTIPEIHPLVAIGAAELALAGNGTSFGAITMRGALDAQTAVSVSYDSRRSTSDERRLFGRETDPMDGARFPAIGDASERRVLAPATGSFAARVERGFDWMEFGDVRPSGFAGDNRLLSYQRSVTGVNGRVTTGDVSWQAFGSVTAQRLETKQLRAMGGAGPFLLGDRIRPGTERVFIEVRARDNAARVVDRRELQRTTDYEISYETGALLLRRSVPASDVADNPVFVVALVERRGAGERKVVGGVRAEVDAGRRLGLTGRDGLTVGASVVRDEAGGVPQGAQAGTPGLPLDVRAGGVSIVGADATLHRGGIVAQAELLHADVADSSALAGRAELKWRSTSERLGLDARWMRVGQGFGASIDPRLSNAVDELALAASVRLRDSSRAELSHRRERFEQFGVSRTTTTARTEQRVRGTTLSQELGIAADRMDVGPLTGSEAVGPRTGTAAVGRLRIADGDARSLFLEGTHLLASTGGAAPQPDRIAAGATWKLFGVAQAELKHEWVSPTDGPSYQSSGLRLRGAAPFGRVWGGLDRADAVRASNSAVLGIEERVRFAKVWSLESAFERRMGIGSAPASDPLRALPFAGPEPEYWTASFGAAFLPGEDRPHATVRAERRDAADEATTRLAFAGDAPFGPGGALLLRSDWRATERGDAMAAVSGRSSRDDRSVLGLALRPTSNDAFDLLGKLEWRRTMNALGGTTFADSTEYRRLIGAADAVWSPALGTELALRYAVRWSARRDLGLAADAAPAPFAQFGGARVERALGGRLAARLDGRLLVEQASGTARWSAAPSLLVRLTPTLHLETGHRFGDLLDADFGDGAPGAGRFFATVGVRFTERLLTSPASFWRDRLAGGR